MFSNDTETSRHLVEVRLPGWPPRYNYIEVNMRNISCDSNEEHKRGNPS